MIQLTKSQTGLSKCSVLKGSVYVYFKRDVKHRRTQFYLQVCMSVYKRQEALIRTMYTLDKRKFRVHCDVLLLSIHRIPVHLTNILIAKSSKLFLLSLIFVFLLANSHCGAIKIIFAVEILTMIHILFLFQTLKITVPDCCFCFGGFLVFFLVVSTKISQEKVYLPQETID